MIYFAIDLHEQRKVKLIHEAEVLVPQVWSNPKQNFYKKQIEIKQ